VASVISAGTLALLKRIKEEAMLDTVYISGPSTRTRVDLPGGAWEYTEGAGEPTATVGMIGPLSKASIERLQADRLEYLGLEQLEVPMEVEVRNEDALYITSARHGTTQEYSVEGVTPLGTYSVSRVVIVKAI
jgi:hypothetical protein